MDLNLVRGVMTAILLMVFIGIIVWAWSSKRKAMFDAAARLPFDEEEDGPGREPGQRAGGVR